METSRREELRQKAPTEYTYLNSYFYIRIEISLSAGFGISIHGCNVVESQVQVEGLSD
jgi:hypothetical protein